MSQTCVVFSCEKCGHREAVASSDYTGDKPAYRTLSGNIIKYRPVPDSFVCPKCSGDMFLTDCNVTEREIKDPSLKEFYGETAICVEAVHTPVKAYNEEEESRKRGDQSEQARKQMMELLQTIINNNIRHLERMEGKPFPLDLNDRFHTDPEQRPHIATINSLTYFISGAIKWSCEDAEELAVSILDDVNLHEQARQVKQLLEDLKKKGY